MTRALILGVGMLRFGKLPGESVKSLSRDAVRAALADAELDAGALEGVWFSNSAWGMNGGQDCIRGEVALRGAGISAIPVVNVENACAGGATALHGAVLAVESGAYDVVLAVGADKLFQASRIKMFASFLGGLDVEAIPELIAEARRRGGTQPRSGATSARRGARRHQRPSLASLARDFLIVTDHYGLDPWQLARDAVRGAGKGRGDKSPFMDVYAIAARLHMQRYGTTERQLALIAAKNHDHGAKNPLAQVQRGMTPDDVLADASVAFPLTRAMCAPIGDGAAAAVVCSERFGARHGPRRAVRVRASVLVSGAKASEDDPRAGISLRASRRAYELAGVGPEAISLGEVHDATAFGELHQSEALGFCAPGEGGALAESGATRIGGRIPLNPSGGLECRGHPIGASGLAQIHELVTQLRGEAGARQVERARLALAQNGGGFLGGEEAAMGVHVLERSGA